jgi:hypothetical protein
MNDNLWKQLESHALEADELIEKFLSSSDAEALQRLVRNTVGLLPEGLSVSLDITLNVFDPERGNVLPLSDTSLTASGNEEPYIAYGDCTPCRYLVDGEICEVPHDRCPNCWAGWNFKIGTPDAEPETLACPCCGYEMGEQIKLMLDDDVCPYCEKGKMSMASPTCDQCGLAIDPRIVSWG